jgi:hypothetical protein
VSDLVEVPFYGDAIQAVRDGEAVSVVLKRVCESLGVDPEGQRQRLRDPNRAPWAVTCMTQATGPDGKNYEVFCIDLECLPMWLATIDASRVKPEAKFKLLAYQKECARVLRDHFFGRASSPAPIQPVPVDAPVTRYLESLVMQVVEASTRMLEANDRLATRLQAALSASVIIDKRDASTLKREIRELADLWFAGKEAKSANSARRRIYNHLGQRLNWGGPSRPWIALPAQLWPEARVELDKMRRDTEARIGVKAKPQLALFPGGRSEG